MRDNIIQKKTLSIRISTNGFCFCSYIPSQPDSLQYHFYPTEDEKSLALNLRSAIDSSPLIDREEEQQIKAIIETTEYTVIPAEYDNRKNYKAYYRCCFPKSDSNIEIASNRLTAQGFTLIFPVEHSVYEVLQSLGEVTYYTPASILMGYITLHPLPEENYMLAYIQDEYSLFIPVKDNKIGITNIFRADNRENHLFYMLGIWKDQGFSQTDDTLYLCGNKSIEEMQLSISRFIKRRKRINPNELFQPSLLNRIEGIPFDLQALILCE